jgi:hypothetical protein
MKLEELPVNEQGNGLRMDLTLRRGDNVVLFDVVVTNLAGPTNMAKRSDIYPLKSANHSFNLRNIIFKEYTLEMVIWFTSTIVLFLWLLRL